MRFENKVAIIACAGSRKEIGYASAHYLAKEGCKIVVADNNNDMAQEVADAIIKNGGGAMAVEVDFSNESSVRKMVELAAEKFGKIDILINAPDEISMAKLLDLSLAEWNRILDINLKTVFFCVKAVEPYMIKNGYGRIVNLSSMAAKSPGYTGVAYAAAKGGMLGFAKSYIKELAMMDAANITFNSVCPGPLTFEEERKEGIAKLPMKRAGKPEEVSAAIAFLVSDEAGYISGEEIDINGGLFND